MENSKGFGKVFKSYSKINLFLKIISKRRDGFHNIFSYFLPLNFYDEIYFEEEKKGNFDIQTFNAYIKKEENLVFKAGIKLLKYARNEKGVRIKIFKNIPLGSGLGGGSSNCATALKFLNKYWECDLNEEELIKIGLSLGSDVPFFIKLKPAIVSGKGEKIIFKKINLKLPKKIVLFIPNFSISTRDVYFAYDKITKKVNKFNKNEYLEKLNFKNLVNDLQEPAFFVCPKLFDIYNKINSTKPEFLMLSGSGSTFWGFYKTREEEEKAKRLLTKFLKFYILSSTNFITP